VILLDTNVISEVWRTAPPTNFAVWLDRQNRSEFHISSVTLGELYFGAHRLPEGRKKRELFDIIAELPRTSFAHRVLAFDAECSDAFGRAKAVREGIGRPIDAADAAIAATALTFGMRLATRNTRDFEGLGLDLINPFGDDA
jgi:toxin FitB